jgi:hypothetical protein
MSTEETPTITVSYVNSIESVTINRAFMLKLDASAQESSQSEAKAYFSMTYPSGPEGTYPSEGCTWDVAQDGTLTLRG